MTIQEQILNCGLREIIQFKEDLTVEFKNCDSGFYWVAERDECWNFFPMQSNNVVKHFKTLKGCKRNFIKRFITR